MRRCALETGNCKNSGWKVDNSQSCGDPSDLVNGCSNPVDDHGGCTCSVHVVGMENPRVPGNGDGPVPCGHGFPHSSGDSAHSTRGSVPVVHSAYGSFVVFMDRYMEFTAPFVAPLTAVMAQFTAPFMALLTVFTAPLTVFVVPLMVLTPPLTVVMALSTCLEFAVPMMGFTLLPWLSCPHWVPPAPCMLLMGVTALNACMEFSAPTMCRGLEEVTLGRVHLP